MVALMMASALVMTACDQVVATAPSVSAEGSPSAANSEVVLTGRVVGVTDGDTLTLLDDETRQHTVRLAEIDAPERGQPWGNRAKQTLSALVSGKRVSVRQTDTDRWGRVVGRVFADEVDVNRAMIEQGGAWAFGRYLTDETLLDVEQRARERRVGLWSMPEAEIVPPWEWRQGARTASAQPAPVAPSQRPQSLLSRRPEVPGQAEVSCGGKRYCRQMTSCAEAHFYLRQCGVASLDGNGDGEPCEVLCGTAQAR